MLDKAVEWAYNQVKEPTKEINSWVVNYQDNKAWKKEQFETHESAFDFYYSKVQNAVAYYNTFLRGADDMQR